MALREMKNQMLKPKKQCICLFIFISSKYNPGIRGQRIGIQHYERGGGYWHPKMEKVRKSKRLYQSKITFYKRKTLRTI